MLISLGFAVLVLGVAFFQSTQGFFSALIMAVLSVCCAALAFGTYEYIAVTWLAPLWKPDFAHALALGLAFGVPLFGLRLAIDRLVKRSSLLPVWIDRFGGGMCGIVTGLVCVGVLACAVLWLPHGTTFLGFSRINIVSKTPEKDAGDPTPPSPDAPIRELLMTPDRFAVALAGMLNDGLFGGSDSFGDSHVDLVRENAWIGAVPPEVRRYAPPGSVVFLGSAPLQHVYREIPASGGGGGGRRGSPAEPSIPAGYEPLSPKGGQEFRMIRLGLKREARDDRKSHVFTLRQFRLVGRPAPDAPLEQHHAVAIQQRRIEGRLETVNRHVRLQKTIYGDWHILDDPMHPRDQSDEVEVVFELPKGFIPLYLDYKRGARVAVNFDTAPRSGRPEVDAGQGDSPDESATAELPPEDTGTRRRRTTEPAAESETPQGGNIKRYTVRTGKSFFGDELPMPLRKYRKPAANVEVRREALIGGHLIANLEEQEEGTDDPISRFSVPSDKRLLQLNTGYLQARSTLGRAMSFAVETLQNYQVEGDNGQVYEVVGKFAVADVDGRQVCEIQYFRDRAGSLGQLGGFNTIKNAHLKGEYEYVLLFLVDPGVTITSFSTGGATSRRDDLSNEGLVAPN